jgi:thiamine-monophosphate kinase
MAASARGWSEASVHRWLFAAHRPKGLATRFGQDAASLRRALQRPVLCADQCIEGVHFSAETSAARAGSKAAARALSDLAASAAQPRALLLCASFPPEREEAWIRAAIRAVAARAREFDAELVGGDLACAPGPCVLSVSAIGDLGRGPRAVSRDRVRAGDLILITGPCGGSLLGRHLRIQPRIREGRWLWQGGARAMTDVSDSLAQDVQRLASRSGVAIELDHVPIHRDARRMARRTGRSALEHALYDGEDHELVLALSPARAKALLAQRAGHAPQLALIGRARAGSGVFAPQSETAEDLRAIDLTRGWNHGRV